MQGDADIQEMLTETDRGGREAWTNFSVRDPIMAAQRQLQASAQSGSLDGRHHRLGRSLDSVDHGDQRRPGHVRPKLLDVCPCYTRHRAEMLSDGGTDNVAPGWSSLRGETRREAASEGHGEDMRGWLGFEKWTGGRKGTQTWPYLRKICRSGRRWRQMSPSGHRAPSAPCQQSPASLQRCETQNMTHTRHWICAQRYEMLMPGIKKAVHLFNSHYDRIKNESN